MTDQWRRQCGRCGSTAVKNNSGRGWHCNGHNGRTPAVYDLKESRWVVEDPEPPDGPVPKDGSLGLGRPETPLPRWDVGQSREDSEDG